MYGFYHVKHFGCSRNFEPLRNRETKGFDFDFYFFFQNKTSPSDSQSRRKEILQSYYITLSNNFRQDLPKLMIPQELSTSYGIKLMLANM